MKPIITSLNFCFAILLIATSLFSQVYADSANSGDRPAGTTQRQDTLTADLVASINPEGAILNLGGYRKWIQETDPEGTPSRYVQAGAGLGVSPAYAKASVFGEWGPAAFATLHLEYDFYSFFGTSSGLLSFPNGDAKFGDDELDNLEGREETGTGHRMLFQPTLYAMAGPVIVMNQTDLAYYRFDGDGPYFLDWEYEMLLKDDDLVLANRTQLFIPAWKGAGQAKLYTGPFYEITHARDADLTRQRAGWFEYWVPVDHFWGMQRPRIYSMAAYNLQDPNRRGEIYMVLGFGMDFDLK